MPIPSLNPQIESFTPTGKKVLVKREEDEKVVGGIIMPENRAKVGLVRAKVISAGAKINAEEIRPGDVILMPRQMGYQRVSIGGVEHEVVPHESIFAVEPQ